LTPAKEKKEVARQADAWEREQKEEYERTHAAVSKQNITFESFVEDIWWVDHVENPKEHTPSTISFFGYMSNDLIDYFGKKKLTDINAEAVKRYVKWCNTEAVTKRGKPYSAATTKHHFDTLRNILEYARRFHYIKYNPCQDLSQKEKPKREKKTVDFLDPKDAKRFVQCLEEEPLFWRCFMNLLIVTGLRRGETVALQWGDVDTDNLTITVQRNVTIDRNSPDKYHVGPTKTEDVRTVPITHRVFSLMMQLKADQEEKYGVVFPSAYIFNRSTDPYKPIYPTEPTRWQSKFVRQYNLPHVSPHDLRHTAATLALEAGANLKDVQTLLGHSDPGTTMKFYAGVTEEAQRRTVTGIEELLSDNKLH
jgi:integrase